MPAVGFEPTRARSTDCETVAFASFATPAPVRREPRHTRRSKTLVLARPAEPRVHHSVAPRVSVIFSAQRGLRKGAHTRSSNKELTFVVSEGAGSVSALLLLPNDARLLYVLAHGAGAGMRHSFLESIAQRLAERSIATLRYQFPYMERRSSRPDSPAVAAATVRAAVAEAARVAPGLPLVAGGKSFGGRMTSTAHAEEPLPAVRGLVFLGFPLHPPGRPGDSRAEHLVQVEIPMLFLQGTRDEFADLKLLRPVIQRLGERATLRLVEGGDHSFHVLKRSGRNEAEVMAELAGAIVDWTARIV